MDPETLFLRRCEQIAELGQSGDRVHLTDCAHYLHQILLDQNHLLATVNRSKLKVRFEARALRPPPSNILPVFHAVFDGIDPDLVPSIPGSTVLRLGLDGFLGLHVMTASGVRLTVKHVIGYVRNVDGGGHYDPRELTGEYKVLRRIAGNLLAPGLDSARMQVRGISRVVLKGLTPVIVDVRARLDASRGRPAPPAPATS